MHFGCQQSTDHQLLWWITQVDYFKMKTTTPIQNFHSIHCAVTEHIHIHPMEGYWKFWRGEGSQKPKPSSGRMGYFRASGFCSRAGRFCPLLAFKLINSSVLHFEAILIIFCITGPFCGEYFIFHANRFWVRMVTQGTKAGSWRIRTVSLAFTPSYLQLTCTPACLQLGYWG